MTRGAESVGTQTGQTFYSGAVSGTSSVSHLGIRTACGPTHIHAPVHQDTQSRGRAKRAVPSISAIELGNHASPPRWRVSLDTQSASQGMGLQVLEDVPRQRGLRARIKSALRSKFHVVVLRVK